MTDELLERAEYELNSGTIPPDPMCMIRAQTVRELIDKILADAKIIKAADELAQRVMLREEGAPMRSGYIGDALAAYRAAVEERDT